METIQFELDLVLRMVNEALRDIETAQRHMEDSNAAGLKIHLDQAASYYGRVARSLQKLVKQINVN